MLEQLNKLPRLPSLASFRKLSPLARREMQHGMLFISLWIFGFFFFITVVGICMK